MSYFRSKRLRPRTPAVAAIFLAIFTALIAACDAALSPIAGPYAVWIDAGCGTAEAA